jgi:hypothetical protein
LRDGKRKRLVDNLPTSKTTGVFIGLVELKGTAESSGPLASYLTEQPCVHYAWSIQEEWERMVVETYTDSEGKTQTRNRTETGWTNVANGGESISFYLQDDCGVILIRPEGAKIEPATLLSQTCGRMDPLYYGKGPPFAVANSVHRRRFVETAIPLHQQLYLMGQARERSDMVAAEIAADPSALMFLISTRSEEQVSSGFGWAFWGWVIAGFILAVGGCVARDLSLHVNPGELWLIYVAAAFAYLIAYGAGWIGMVFNSMVDLRQRVRQAWSQVDVQLKRRQDLIPNLVNAVQGFRDYEKNLQTELAAMRSQLTATPPGVAGPDFRAVNQTVIAIAERYPELKASDSFASLQRNLIDTEQRIALARGYFNDIATFYNTRLEIVPDKFVASLGAMNKQALMEANDFERAPVKVDVAAA